jgi:hypothetical protein
MDPTTGYETLLAGNVAVSPVTGAPYSGTANAVVNLPVGSYWIDVEASGNYSSTGEQYIQKTGLIFITKPAVSNTITGCGTFTTTTSAAGTYASQIGASFTVKLTYNKGGANPQGQILISIPQSDGSTIIIKSNAINSVAVTASTATVYTKASIYRVSSTGVVQSIDGNATLRMDITNGNQASGSQVGFTVLSSKDSSLYYSNDWAVNSVGAWITLPDSWSSQSGSTRLIY